MDVVMQVGSQAYAQRICAYARDSSLQLFPAGEGFGESALELGPKTAHSGPCLALLRNCTASTQKFIDLVESSFLQRYLVRMYWCGLQAATREEMMENTKKLLEALSSSGDSFTKSNGTQNPVITLKAIDLPDAQDVTKKTGENGAEKDDENLEELRKSRGGGNGSTSEVLRGGEGGKGTRKEEDEESIEWEESIGGPHIQGQFPVGGRQWGKGKYSRYGGKKRCAVPPNGAPLPRDHAQFVPKGDRRLGFAPGDPVVLRLQTFPRSLADWIMEKLPEGSEGFRVHPSEFTHTLSVVEAEEGIFFGVFPGRCMWINPMDRVGVTRGLASKAMCKLEEALRIKGFPLDDRMTAVDVGAAPGAWTEFLSTRVGRVIAVDPALLDKNVLSHNVVHIQRKVEDALDDLEKLHEGKKFDILVCDANKHPLQTAVMLDPLLPHMKPGALIVMTMKFRGRGRSKELVLTEVLDYFKAKLHETSCVWLMANSVYERTFVARTLLT